MGRFGRRAGLPPRRALAATTLVAAGYKVLAVNPLATSRYRGGHATSVAKSDPWDAKVLAEPLRTDAHNHRSVAGDSELVQAIKTLARAHQGLVWTRQRQTNQLRFRAAGVLPGCARRLR